MAREINITGETEADRVFLGDDTTLTFPVVDDAGVPIDVSTWALEWDLRVNDKASTALISKATGSGISVTGSYNVDPLVNTQRVAIALADTDSDASTTLKAKAYRHGLKRMTAGAETTLAYGKFVFWQSTVR